MSKATTLEDMEVGLLGGPKVQCGDCWHLSGKEENPLPVLKSLWEIRWEVNLTWGIGGASRGLGDVKACLLGSPGDFVKEDSNFVGLGWDLRLEHDACTQFAACSLWP